jgi:hypothetical protein
MSEETKTCCACGKPINGLFMSCGGDKQIHRHCWERDNMPTVAGSLYEVARGHSDPVLAAQSIAALVPAELAAQIVRSYNRKLLLAWQSRCEED